MNNRFRFRAWLKNYNKIVDIYQITDNDSVHFVKFLKWNDNINTPNIECLDQLVLMQAIGLKDKNGKLIYEGDIVKTEYDSINGYDAEYRASHIGIVKFDKTNCHFYKQSIKQEFGRCFGINNDINEVIGNIYENKELLEKE